MATMVNLSNEQKDYLQKLTDWASSDECKQTIYNRLCSAFQELIIKKEKSKEQIKLNLLKEELAKEKEKNTNGAKYSKTISIVESIHRNIERCYESELFGIVLLKYIHNIDAAKEYLLASQIRLEIPSDNLLDIEIGNRQKVQKIDSLISILDKWIEDLENTSTFSNNRIDAIKAKYQKYRSEFHMYRFLSSVCVLSHYIDKPEEAKAFLSEIFTKRQEIFYSNLEKWAESLEDKKCGKWLSSFLHKGRDLRIRSITVLRYIDDEDKAKAFLLSKYDEKLDWDKKKRDQREIRRKSVFDSYNDYKNSLSSFIPGLTKDTKLYSRCISTNSNDKIEPLTMMSYEDGIKIWKDCIRFGAWGYHLSLQATNQLFYIYCSTYRKHTRTFTFFSSSILDIIKEYCSAFLDRNLLDHTMGCVVIREFDSKKSIKCYTCLLTDEASQFSKDPIFVYKSLVSSSKFYHDVAGYRLVFKALIWHLLKDKTSSIDFSADRDFTQEERKLLFELISQFYDSMPFEDKNICHFIDTDKYRFPDNEHDNQIFYKKSYSDRIINLKHCVSSQYDSQIFEDRFFQWAKIKYEYGDTNFKKLAETIGGNISKGKYIDLWFDNTSADFISNLRVLTFLNWAYVSNDTGNVKKITACWLIYIIYKQYKDSYERDKNFWTLMLAYILIENQLIFNTLISRVKKDSQKVNNNIDVPSIVMALTKNIKQLKKELSYEQKCFLSDNVYKCTLFEDYQKRNKEAKCCNLKEAVIIINDICELIEANKGIIKDYSKQSILELLIDVPKFEVPHNFTYTSHHSYNYDRYNGDFTGTYAHDVMGYSNSDIETIFDGEPDAYWNID
ncbi:MAG: hypothetical protein IKM77_08385 [Prevotella sp.]|nr:hypothetical protein [Prevotella sp.]